MENVGVEGARVTEKIEEEKGSKEEPSMGDGQAVKTGDKAEEDKGSMEPQIGAPEAVRSEGLPCEEEISEEEEEKRVDPLAGYAGRAPRMINTEFYVTLPSEESKVECS